MIYQLDDSDFYRVGGLVRNTTHELSVEAVIVGNAPGKIYVDDRECPKSTLILAPECNVCAGEAGNAEFNAGIRDVLGFFDPITCDSPEWESNIHQIHGNIAVRRYIRRYYELSRLVYTDFRDILSGDYHIEYVTVDNLESLSYGNSDSVREWFHFADPGRFKDYSLGAFVRIDDEIVSWSLVDCIVGDKAEIGVKTDPAHRRKGLGAIAAAAAVSSCLENGISSIGWHCVDTNVGSIGIAEKVGFRCVKKYGCFTPFPPIENTSDLSRAQWVEWAQYYEEMNKVKPDYYWMAATCWAKASMLQETIANIMRLVDTGQTWFHQYFSMTPEFDAFAGNEEWQRLMQRISI